jgi:hypothetical protein
VSFAGGAARIVCTQALGLLLVGQASPSMAQPTAKARSVTHDNENTVMIFDGSTWKTVP